MVPASYISYCVQPKHSLMTPDFVSKHINPLLQSYFICCICLQLILMLFVHFELGNFPQTCRFYII
jgi:hypothetical protein